MSLSIGARSRIVVVVLLVIATVIPVVIFPRPAIAAPVDCSRGVNLGFETPLVRDNPMGPPPNWALFDESLVPGWNTSAADDLIELWESTFLGVPSFAGGQLAEMNATQPSIFSQDISTLEGDSIDWFVAHRARTGPTDSADIRFGAPGTPVLEQVMTSPTGSWTTYSGTYVVPSGQTTTQMSFLSNDPGSLGNFLDGIDLELECEITVATSFTGFTDTDGSGHTNPGDTAGFSYLVTNVGSATVQTLTVDDLLGFSASCPATALMPGESTTCTFAYVLTAGDVDGGSIDSDVTATALDAAGVVVTDSDILSELIAADPSITVNKSATLDDTVVAPAGQADAGDAIDYSFNVTNTGNVTLDPVSVSDPTAGTVTCPGTTLGSLESMICTATLVLTQGQVDSGSLANTATATGTFGTTDVTADDSANVVIVAVPAISIAKSSLVDDTVVGPAGRIDAGDRVDYLMTITNIGNVSLDTIAVSDPTVGTVNCPQSSVLPGDSFDCTASVILDQTTIDSGMLSNVAAVFGNPPSGDPGDTGDDATSTDSDIVDITPQPSLGIAKSLSGFDQQADGTIVVTFLYTLTNYGNVTVSDLSVTDDVVSLFAAVSPEGFAAIDGSLTGSPVWDGTGASNILAGGQTLAPDATENVSTSFVITASTETTIDNTASVGGLAPDSAIISDDSVDGTDPDPDGDGDPSNNTEPTPVIIPALYDLSISKTGVEGPGESETTWIIVVTNNGPANAPGTITVVDTPGAGLAITSASGTGWTCTVISGSATCENGGGIASSSSSTITVVATTATEPGTIVSNAVAATGGDGNDVNPENNEEVSNLAVGGLPVTGFSPPRLTLFATLLILLGGAVTGVARKRETGQVTP